MRKEYYNYTVKMPAVLHEMFREKVSDYHFSNMAAVMNHLIKSYIAICDRKKSIPGDESGSVAHEKAS